MRHVISQHFFLDPAERGAHRRDLRNNVDAVAVLVDHLGEAADLAFDPAQAFLTGSLDVFPHPAYIPLQGMGFKARMERLMGTTEHAPAGEAKAGCGDHSGHGHDHRHADVKAAVRDPVCGMSVDPAKYLDKQEPQAEVPAGTIYTCPMHPQIR